MNVSRSRKVLIAAFAISFLLHLIFAGYFQWPGWGASPPEMRVVTIRHLRIFRITPTPAPPPQTPHPPAKKSKVSPPILHNRGPGVSVANVTSAPATPAPIVSHAPPAAPPTAQPCTGRDIAAAVTATPDPIAIPPEARASKVSGIAAVAVQLDAQGNVTKAGIAQSSGNAGLDAVAVQIAKAATYSPATSSCKPVASSYTFTVNFQAW
jgi:TonB family protein